MGQNHAVANPEEVISFPRAKARRFLAALRDNPFVTIIVEGDTYHVYSQGMSPESLGAIRDVLSKIEREDGTEDQR